MKYCLKIMHHYGIIHRDIKPANLLKSSLSNRYVLADFGLSTYVPEKVGMKSKTTYQGTPRYMSEEMKSIDGEGVV